jgi:hypothetical protein
MAEPAARMGCPATQAQEIVIDSGDGGIPLGKIRAFAARYVAGRFLDCRVSW